MRKFELWWLRILFAFLLPMLIHSLFMPLSERINSGVRDSLMRLRYNLRGPLPSSPYLTILNLDDSFEKRFDCPDSERRGMAEVIRQINYRGARTVLVDIFYEACPDSPRGNQALAEATGDGNNLFFPLILTHQEESGGKKKPFPALARNARGLGGIRFIPEGDGIIRRVPLYYNQDDMLIPSLLLSGLCHYFKVPGGDFSLVPGKGVRLKSACLPGELPRDLVIPTDSRGYLMVNFAGPWKDSLKSFSLESMLTPETEESYLAGLLEENIVFIGDITSRKKDIAPGVFEPDYPLSGVMGNALNTILTRNWIILPGWKGRLLTAFILICLMLFLDALKWRPGIITGTVYLFYLIISFFLFVYSSLVPEPILFGLTFLFTYLGFIKGPEKPPGEIWDFNQRFRELGLTKKEMEVAPLLMKGLQYQEIADELSIKPSAVSRRVNRMYRRLEINNKVEFVNRVRENNPAP